MAENTIKDLVEISREMFNADNTETAKAFDFAVEKLKAAGIEVVQDKDEFTSILNSEKNIQKMVEDLSDIEKLANQLSEEKEKTQELNEKVQNLEDGKKKNELSKRQISIDFIHSIDYLIPYTTENRYHLYNKYLDNGIIVGKTEHENKNVYLVKTHTELLLAIKRQSWSDEPFIKTTLDTPESSGQYKTIFLSNDEIIKNLKDLLQNKIVKEQQIQNKNFQKIEKLDNELKSEKSDDIIESFKAISNVLKTGDEDIVKNPTLDDVEIRFGAKNKGLAHIIIRRMEERTHRSQNSLSIEDAQKEVAMILTYVREAVIKSEAKITPRGNFNAELKGIKAVIDKDENGRYVLTGFDNKQKKEESAETINAGIAKYGYAPEFLEMYAQVGAVYSSYQNISQNQNKSTIQEMTLSDGTVYGFTHEGKIYLNPDVLSSNTPIHEYTHLWDKYTENTNPELWEKGKEAFKQTSLWNEVISDPNYADIKDDENLVLSECHARICGNIAEKVLERIAAENGEIAKDAVIDWDKDFWTYIAENYSHDITKFASVAKFMTMPMKDFWNEKEINIEQVKNFEFEKIGATKENVNKNIEIITSVQGFANLKFNEKPTEEIRNILRENGWYYSRNNNVWYPSVKSKQRTAELSNQFAEKLIQQFDEKPLEEQLDEYIEQMAANGGMSEETISMLAEEDEIQRAELYEEEMQDKAEREEEHSEINVEELKDGLKSALHEVAEPLIEIDFTRENYQALFPRYRIETPLESAKLGVNQFEKLEAKDRQKLLSAVYSTLKTPDLIVDEKKTEIDKLFGDEVEKESHIYAKSFVIEGKEKAVQSVVVSIDDDNVSISTHERDINNIVNKIKTPDQLLYVATAVRRMAEQHTQNEQSVVSPNRVHNFVDIVTPPNQNYNENTIKSISDLIAEGKITSKTVEKSEVSIKLSGNNIEIPVEDAEQIENLKEWDVRDEISEYLEPDHSVSGQQILETMQMIAEEEAPEIEENFAYKNQENEETENYITKDELEAFKEIVPLAQYVATLDLITNSEEKEFFIHKVKEIVKNVEAAPKMGKTDGEKEHPLVLKYFHPTGTQALVCEIGKHGEAYGYQILNGDHQMAEWGYINLNEFKNIPGMEIDYHIDEGMSIERYLYSENPKKYPQYAELAGNENNEPSVESFNQAEIAKQENFNTEIQKDFSTLVLNEKAYWVDSENPFLEKLQKVNSTEELFALAENESFGISNTRVIMLARTHQICNDNELKGKIESYLEEINWHTETELLRNEKYSEFESLYKDKVFNEIMNAENYYGTEEQSKTIHEKYVKEIFKSIREYEKNHENNTAQNLTENETRRNIMEESLQENDVLEEQSYGRTGENFSNGTGNLRTEHQILSGSEGKDTGRPYNEGSGSHDMAQFNDTKEASMGRDSGLERSTSGSDSLPMDGTSASDEQGNGAGQSEAVSADLSNSNGQISKDIKSDDSTGSNSTGRGNLQAAELEEELRTAHGSTEQLRNGTFVSELTKKEMKDVRSEVKKILENKKNGEEWTSSELALARLYEGGGGLKEKDATSNEILNAYYTPYKIIDAVWKLADSYAPNAVTVLEPSSGIGRFADNRLHNEFTLRELDEISSKLAKVLHPDATVISGAFQSQFFDETGRIKKENYELPKYDLVIGNPPYGENKNEWTGRGEGSEHTRYDQYFIEKALDSLKDENSVLAFVIPSGTLNSGVNRGKELIASKGVLVDAYRLPNNAFPTTQVGTDIVIFKKGAMDVNNLCSNSFFEKHPEKVLGEVSTRSGRFGDEYCVNIPEGETLDTLLTKINSDIKNRGIDLEMIHENQIKNHLERIAEKNRKERNTAAASKEKKKKSNIEKLLDEVKKDSLEVVHLYNAIGNGKVKVSKNPLSEIKNDRGRNIYGFSSSYDIETKKAFVTHRDELLATIDENGIVTNAFSKEDFKELSPGKREQVAEYISRATKETVFLNENLLGIHEGKYYLNNAGTRTAYMIHAKLFDSKNKVHLDDFELSNTLVPAITAEKSNLDDFDLRDFRLMNERNSDYGYSRLYKSRLFYPKFETIYPENGNFDFNALLDEIGQNEMTIEDNIQLPDFRNTSYEEDEKNLALYREKISSLVLENSSVKSVDEYIQKLKEKNSEISEIRKNRTEKILSERNANQEAENLYGSLYLELSKMNFAKTMAEKFVGSYLVESRQDEKNPYQINVYIDQKRKFSVLQDSSKNVTLVSYNNERLPLSFVKAMYERFGERFYVSAVSPFEEKILSLDDIVKKNQKKTASKALCEVAEKSLVEIFSDRELDSELNFEIENHKARIVQKGTHKQVFFDGSKYAALDFEKITQKLTVNNEVYNSGLQDFVSEKTSELNPDCKVKRDFTINGKRYIDSDGKTKLAPPKSPRYSPKQEDLMTNKDFASLYGSKWNEDERIFFEVSDGFGGYINLNRLNEEQQKILRQSKNYVEEYPNKFIHREFYASGNIYKKIDKLEEDFSSGKVPLELYEKNLKILKKAVPNPIRNAEISILSSTVSDYEINGENIKEAFLAWAVGRDIEGSGNTLDSIDDFSSSNVKREEIPSTINWKDVYDYVNGIELAKISGDELSERQKNKLRSQKMNDRKLCAEKLFSRFLNEGLSKDEQDRFWNQYNRINHAIRTPDWSKLPLYIEGMNKYRNGVDFKLYDQQIKGVSFLCNKGNGLLAYDVGVGKTAAGIVATVNQIQTGKAKRPLIIVPKTVISQWESDIHELFPDVQVNNLDNLSSRAIANFYDGKHGLNIPEGSITLVTKEALNNISFTESTRNEMLKDFQDLTGVSNEQFSKMSDKEREDYKNKLRDLFGQAEKIDSKDFVFFENCGFDNITVDEAQYYKNLFKVPRTKQANEFTGMGSGKPSKRAVKMFVISQQIQKQNDGRNVFLLSATPFTNSPSEIYSMLIYMARKEMEEQGIKNFYDFCAKHIKTQYEPVVKPNGEIEYANVIKSFNELDALQDSLLSQFIDKVDGEEAGIVRPNKHTLLSKMEATPLQKEIFNFCTNVLMEYDPKKDTNPNHDDEYKRHHSGMILEAINIMRTACLSPALVNAEKLVDPYTENHSGIVVPELDDVVECSPKLKLVCDTVVKNWKENHTHGQLIFMPQGTVAYPKVVEYMVKQGVPKEVFATVDGSTAKIGGKSVKMSKNDEDNEQVRTVVAKAFNDRENPCKILIGSDAIKEGINLNGNSIAMYNCMLGWNPSDAIQAEGRVWRQGNRQGDVNIVYPLIYNSVDSLIYQKYDEKKSRIDALWEKSDGEDKKIDLAEINPADLKFDLIKDPVKRAKLELGGEKEKVRQEILNIRNSILNFEGYVKKLEALTETLQSRREQKADYIANYRNALFEGKETRTEEEQKKGIERYDASILKAENSIKAMQKKIDGELNKNSKVYTKETFKAEKQNEIEVLEEKVKTFDSPEVMQPIIDKYRIKLAEEAVLNLSAEEKNPLDKRIQAVLRPAYFTQWERKNERAELLIQAELDKIDELHKSLDAENESESRQEIKEIKQNIAHLRNENNEFRADWMHKYGTYDTALKFWNETHIEIEPEKEKKVLHNAKVEDIQKETVKDSPKIQTAEKLETAIMPPNGEPAASEKKAELKLMKAELQGYLFDIDDSNSFINKEIKPAEKAEIKAVEKQPVDISKTDSFTKIDFDFKEEKGFSFGYLKKCGLIPPCKPENNGMVKVMGEDKTEYLMTKRQVSHMVDNAVFHAKNHLQIDVAELSKSVPKYRKQFLNDTLMEVGQERMAILRNRQNENKTELNKSIEQNNVSVSRS